MKFLEKAKALLNMPKLLYFIYILQKLDHLNWYRHAYCINCRLFVSVESFTM